VARHHEDACYTLKCSLKRRPISQFGNGSLGVLSQNITRLVSVAHDTNWCVTELREFLDNCAARVAGRANNGDHGLLPCEYAGPGMLRAEG
jgi:hypothetical protein